MACFSLIPARSVAGVAITSHNLTLVFAALLAGILVTPSPSPTPLPVIGTVKVATGSPESIHRLPVPASLMDSAAVAGAPDPTGDGLLRELPGFDRDRSNSMFTNYGQLRVSFSGAGNDRGLVLADGVPAQDGFGGQIDWAEYPALDITRAEILRGPGSALYGSGAIGGVLALQTFGPEPATQPAQGLVSFSAGTHAFAQNYARLDAPLTNTLSMSLSASMQQLQYDDLAPGYQAPHDSEAQAQDSMTSFRLRYAAGTQTTIDYGYRGAWDYQQEGRPNYDFWRRIAQNMLGVTHGSSHANVSGGVYERDGFVTNRADIFPKDPGVLLYTQYVPTHESGATAGWIVDNPNSTFEMRADGKFVGGTSDQYNGEGAFSVSGTGSQNEGGLALQETLRGSAWEFVAGVRGDTIDTYDAETQKGTKVSTIPNHTYRAASPRAALRYDLTKRLAFRASAGDGFRAPYLNELVRGYVIGPISYLPNASLVPERSSSLSSGLDWTQARNDLSADFTHSFVTDAIDFCTISATVQERCNFTRTQTDGTTVSYVHGSGACSRFTLSGTQQYARITEGTAAEIGKQLPYVPKADANAGYDTPIGAVQTGFTISYLGTTYADDLNEEPLGRAFVAGMHASIPLVDGSSVALNVSNLTDARYLSSIDRYAPPQVISLAVIAPVGAAHPAPACL
jgi:iron complex outermembrane recepter protein